MLSWYGLYKLYSGWGAITALQTNRYKIQRRQSHKRYVVISSDFRAYIYIYIYIYISYFHVIWWIIELTWVGVQMVHISVTGDE